MATGNLTHAGITINSVDLSDHVTAVSLEVTYDDIDVTAYGDTIRKRAAGLGDGSVSLTFLQDYAASKTYATLQPLAGTTTTIAIEPDSASATGATNPTWSCSVSVNQFMYISHSIGEAHTMDVTWPLASAITISTGA